MQSFSRVNYFGHYILFPPSPLFSLISVCWLISDVSCTSKRFITTMKVEGLVLFEKGYVRDYESNEQNTTVTSRVKSNERSNKIITFIEIRKLRLTSPWNQFLGALHSKRDDETSTPCLKNKINYKLPLFEYKYIKLTRCEDKHREKNYYLCSQSNSGS